MKTRPSCLSAKPRTMDIRQSPLLWHCCTSVSELPGKYCNELRSDFCNYSDVDRGSVAESNCLFFSFSLSLFSSFFSLFFSLFFFLSFFFLLSLASVVGNCEGELWHFRFSFPFLALKRACPLIPGVNYLGGGRESYCQVQQSRFLELRVLKGDKSQFS